jgi:hypothetical protein
MGKQSRTKRDRRRARPDALTLLIRSACTQCGHPVVLLTPEQATTRGIDLTAALAFFDLPRPAS